MQIEPEIAGQREPLLEYIFSSSFAVWSFTEVKDFYTLGARIPQARTASAPDASVVRLRLVYLFSSLCIYTSLQLFHLQLVICWNDEECAKLYLERISCNLLEASLS